MEQKVYTLDGRQFRTEGDYARAKRDKELIDKIREKTDFGNKEELENLRRELRSGSYRFLTILERDFLDEVEEQIKKLNSADNNARSGKRTGKAKKAGSGKDTKTVKNTKLSGNSRSSQTAVAAKERERGTTGAGRIKTGSQGKTGQDDSVSGKMDSAMEESVKEELKKREKRRKLILILCSLAAVCSLGYFGVYSYYTYRTQNTYRELSALKDKAEAAAASTSAPATPEPSEGPLYTLNGEPEQKEVLEEYKELLQRNRKLIGWLTIEGTNIDYPVMQTTDNEYYLTHNMSQEYDKNGTIFMDKDCDVLKPSTNYILYGHHMMNGKMFGQLDLYQKESFCEDHPYINFDTIYEKGTYQVMYVFKETVHKETEIVFKYYQFIDANGAAEFDSYMQEMAEMSLYDTGVTAEYGDRLLTLSTCNERETDGRFVVVAKKIAEE